MDSLHRTTVHTTRVDEDNVRISVGIFFFRSPLAHILVVAPNADSFTVGRSTASQIGRRQRATDVERIKRERAPIRDRVVMASSHSEHETCFVDDKTSAESSRILSQERVHQIERTRSDAPLRRVDHARSRYTPRTIPGIASLKRIGVIVSDPL